MLDFMAFKQPVNTSLDNPGNILDFFMQYINHPNIS